MAVISSASGLKMGIIEREERHHTRKGTCNLSDMPDCVEYGAIHPLHDGHGTIAALGFLGLPAADALDFILDILQWANREVRALRCFEQVLPAWINCDPSFGYDDVDEFSRAAQRGDLVDNHGNAVAEGRNSEDGAFSGQTVLPSSNAVEQPAVRVGHHVGVEIRVHFRGAEDNRVDHGREIAFAVVVVGSEW